MHQHDTDTHDMDVIVGRDDREIDITWELRELFHIRRMHHSDDAPHPADARTLHRMGWGLIAVAGLETAIDLIDAMLEDEEITLPSRPTSARNGLPSQP